MRVAIEAPGVGARGGRAILEALLYELRQERGVEGVTVFGLKSDPELPDSDHRRVIPNSYPARIHWALVGWPATSARFERSLSFTGFARPARGGQHTCFIHNALYYEDGARLLGWVLRARLAVLKRLTHVSARAAARVVVQSPHMAEHVRREHGVDAEVVVTVPPLPRAAREPVLSGERPRLLAVGNNAGYKRWELLFRAIAGLPLTTHVVGFSASDTHEGLIYSYPSLSRAQIHRAMLESDMLVMTSDCESLGLPLYEALDAGLPIIAPALPYARFACADHAEYFEPGDAESLRALIRQQLSSATEGDKERRTFVPHRGSRRGYTHSIRSLLSPLKGSRVGPTVENQEQQLGADG